MNGGLLATGLAMVSVASAVDVTRKNHNGQPFLPALMPALGNSSGLAKQHHLEAAQLSSPSGSSRHPVVEGGAQDAFAGVAILIAVAFIGMVAVFAETRAADSGTSAAVPHRRAAPMLQVLDVIVVTAAVAIDGIISTIATSLLPEIIGSSRAEIIVFARPLVALVTMPVLIGWLQGGVRSGRVAIGVGLLLLAITCMVHSMARSVVSLLVGHAVYMVASSFVLVSAAHTVMLQASLANAGLSLNAVLAAAAASFIYAPWVGSALRDSVGDTAMMVFLAGAAAFICCVWALVSLVGFDKATSASSGIGIELKTRSALEAIGDAMQDRTQLILLGGVLLSAAGLSLHGASVPLYLGSLQSLNPAALEVAQGCAGVVLVLTVLSCGVVYDSLGGAGVLRGMVIGLVMNMLGLRTVIQAQASADARQMITLIGFFTSHCGLGMYLGFALPTLIVLARIRGPMVFSDLGAAPTAAFAAFGLGLMWFLGDVIGMGFQLILCPIIGLKNTILTFASALLVHTVLVLTVPRLTLGADKDSAAQADLALGAAIEEASEAVEENERSTWHWDS
mmetsp:Transcript_114909/g.199123  ORF Transcript_114909/g.199123 Transcript_114909/m.199123 type:complete len:564 (-) Transcript_114909:17-1708(-)